METIDNFETIKCLLEFANEDDFYFVQILQRKKEHPELGSNSRVIKTYYIRNLDHFEGVKDEIMKLCIMFNARAYLHPTKRSFEKTTYQTLKMITDYIIQPDFPHAHRCWDSACGKYSSGKKRWIIDIDDDTASAGCEEITDFINSVEPLDDKNKVLLKVPTKNGYHLITKPFNLMTFNKKFPEIDVHKNNPTLLFAVKYCKEESASELLEKIAQEISDILFVKNQKI